MTPTSHTHVDTGGGQEQDQEEKKDALVEGQAHGVDAQEAREDGNGDDREQAAKLGRELFVFTNAKAGMQSVDAARVQQVVYDMSKDSAFFQNSLRQNDRVEARIRGMQVQLAQLSRARREQLSRDIGQRVVQLERARSLARTVVVVDMDMFYAAVEMRDNPALRDVPLAVGGISMISTTNYAARKFGVRAAMPGFIGKELCPSLVFVPPNFDKYTRVAQQIRAVFAQYDPDFSAFSLDEACLDISDYMAANWQRYAVGGGAAGGEDGSGEDERKKEDDGGSEETAVGNWNDEEDEGDACQVLGDIVGVSGDSDGESSEHLPGSAVSSGGKVTGTDERRTEDGGTRGGDAFAALRLANKSRKRRRTSLKGPGVPSSCRLEIASAIVAEMRRKIFEVTQLTASAGIACNTMLAKVCSDMNKPNGQFALPFTRQDVVAFVQKLPVRKISGIGKVMEKTLAALGATTGGELFEQRVALFHVFSEKTASWLLRTSLGIQQPRQQGEASARKSFSRERTFRDMSDQAQLERKCREICERLASDLAAAQAGARNVTLKLKLTDFSVRSRSVSLASAISSSDQLFDVAVDILRKELPLTLRLMGFRASRLVDLSNNHNAGGDVSDGGDQKKKQLAIEKFATSDAGGGLRGEDSGDTIASAATGASATSTIGPAVSSGSKTAAPAMDAFVAAMPFPMDAFQPCPICGRPLSVTNIIAVNTHIDACIEGRSDPSQSSAQPARKKPKPSRRQQKHSIHSFFRTNRGNKHS